jgi:hypothetical protein
MFFSRCRSDTQILFIAKWYSFLKSSCARLSHLCLREAWHAASQLDHPQTIAHELAGRMAVFLPLIPAPEKGDTWQPRSDVSELNVKKQEAPLSNSVSLLPLIPSKTRTRTTPYFSLSNDLGIARLDLSAVRFDEVTAGLRGRVARFALIHHLQCRCPPRVF